MLPTLLLSVAALFSQDAPIDPTHLLIKLRAGAPAREVAGLHRLLGARVLRDLPQIRWQIVDVPPEQVGALREAYRARRDVVELAEYDRGRPVAYAPNDPYWPGMWHLTQIGADVAWNTQRGSPAVVVGVIDTGLDVTHPDIAANVWTNPGEIAGNGLDDDGNGYVDDVHGYDFAYDDPDPDDVFGHGTQCAGIIAAVQDNALGVTGIAPLTRVAGIKTATDSGYLYDSANVPGMLYCADQGFRVISMSFYSDDVSPAERDAIDYCWAQGVVPVAAAGNDARVYPYYPGAFEHVISVAAIDGSYNRAWFSNWGSWVDVAAPGLSISTLTPGGGYTTSFAGTSGACPHVAGLAALLCGANLTATNQQVRDALENGAIPVFDPALGEYTGYGRIWCPESIDCLLGGSCTPSPARFLFMAPCGGGPIALEQPLAAAKFPRAIVYGTHFDVPANARLLRTNLSEITPARRTRNTLEFGRLSNLESTYHVQLNGGAQSFTLPWEQASGWFYAPSDAGTNGPGAPLSSGNFAELVRDDGLLYTCSARSDGLIHVELVIRKVLVPDVDAIELRFTRQYQNTAGTEGIEFYDWSTASFPYGSFVSVSSAAVTSGALATLSVALPANPARFIDPEGTLYVRITTNGAAGNGKLLADSFRLLVR